MQQVSAEEELLLAAISTSPTESQKLQPLRELVLRIVSVQVMRVAAKQ